VDKKKLEELCLEKIRAHNKDLTDEEVKKIAQNAAQ
jgi:hypothetical protein